MPQLLKRGIDVAAKIIVFHQVDGFGVYIFKKSPIGTLLP